MTRARVVVVGLGRMGRRHVAAARETAGLDVSSAIDPRADATDLGVAIARELSALDASSFDAAIVATPSPTHHAVARALVAMGKHVLVEKPLATTAADADELVSLARARGVALAAGHVERFQPAIARLRALLADGALGAVRGLAATRAGPRPERAGETTDVVLDLAVHDLDLARWLLGPLRVQRAARADDDVRADLTNDDGVAVRLRAAYRDARERTLRVDGERAACAIDLLAGTCVVERSERVAQVEVAPRDPLRAELARFADVLAGGAWGDLARGEDGAAAVALAEGVSAAASR